MSLTIRFAKINPATGKLDGKQIATMEELLCFGMFFGHALKILMESTDDDPLIVNNRSRMQEFLAKHPQSGQLFEMYVNMAKKMAAMSGNDLGSLTDVTKYPEIGRKLAGAFMLREDSTSPQDAAEIKGFYPLISGYAGGFVRMMKVPDNIKETFERIKNTYAECLDVSQKENSDFRIEA